MDKLDDMKWRVGFTCGPLTLVMVIVFIFMMNKIPELNASHDRLSGLAFVFIFYLLVLILYYATTRFWAWKLSDYSYYNSAFSSYSRWTRYILVVVYVGIVVLLILDWSNLRNDALYNAVFKEDTATVRKMLDLGADPDYYKHRNPIIFISLYQRNKEIFMILLDHGVNLQARNSSGITILTHTLATGPSYDHLTDQLLKHGAKPDFLDRADVELNYNKYLQRQAKRNKVENPRT